MAKVFVSYSHKDGDWVWTRLKPVLEAGGVEVLLDEEHFRPGGALHRQMDALQDRGERQLLVLNRASLASAACRYEQARAIALDPRFVDHIVIPIRRDDADWPPELTGPNPLYVDLRDDSNAREWDKLLRECGADLKAAAPEWLDRRDRIVTALREGRSTNLVVSGALETRPLAEHIRDCRRLAPLFPDVRIVDLHDPATNTRPGLLQKTLHVWSGNGPRLRGKPHDLVDFAHQAQLLPPLHLALLHFDWVERRRTEYGADLFAALRHLSLTERRLTLLIESRRPALQLMPDLHGSPWVLETLELRGTP